MLSLGALFTMPVDQYTARWRPWLENFARFSFVFLFLLITFISLVPGGEGSDLDDWGINDKLAHLLAYLSIMGAGIFSLTGPRERTFLFAGLVVYSLCLEFGQSVFIMEREGSIGDFAANAVGLILGILLSRPVGHLFVQLGQRWVRP